jgi:hypothetical protein
MNVKAVIMGVVSLLILIYLGSGNKRSQDKSASDPEKPEKF